MNNEPTATWQPALEAMSADATRALQAERFRETVQHIFQNAPVQRGLLAHAGVDASVTLDDIACVPFCDKVIFRDNYPFGLFAVPREQLVRLHGTSGTTGKPAMGGYTARDLQDWRDLISRVAVAAGVRAGDIAQIAFGFGLFTGGFGLYQGLEQLGCCILPMGAGQTEKQLMMMQDMGSTVLISTPSYALYLAEVAAEKGLTLPLRVGMFGGEGSEMREEIERGLGIIATNNYGLCELGGPGVSGECTERNGLHIAEDHYYAEIIDPETGAILPEGQAGELVLTSLRRQALPLLRYRTHDICTLDRTPCPCGRTHVRMSPPLGRSDDMILLRGTNVFPSQIEGVLQTHEHIGNHYLLVLSKKGNRDELEVQVELVDEALLEQFARLENLSQEIENHIRNVVGVSVRVTLVAPKTIERFRGKAKRIVDNR